MNGWNALEERTTARRQTESEDVVELEENNIVGTKSQDVVGSEENDVVGSEENDIVGSIYFVTAEESS
jgi:hypothetical protein